MEYLYISEDLFQFGQFQLDYKQRWKQPNILQQPCLVSG